jgi:hypothetical protein
LENGLFGRYSITKYLALYLLRELLEKDPMGKEFCTNPKKFTGSPALRARAGNCIDRIAKIVIRILNTEANRRDRDDAKNQTGLFDFKNELKSPSAVRQIKDNIITSYQILADNNGAPMFSNLWNKAKKRKRSA